MEVGLYGDLLSLNFEAYRDLAMDLTWFKGVWEYAALLCVGIGLSSKYQLQSVCQYDILLMESFS